MTTTVEQAGTAVERIEQTGRRIAQLVEDVCREMPGQEEAAVSVAEALFGGGHVLLEGPPGTGKSRLAELLARHVELSVGRLSMTPDMIPADILGTDLLSADERGGLHRVAAHELPLSHNLVVLDGPNRATPRTQSALLEAMQERRVTLGGVTHELPDPFMVLACQVPGSMEGTYPLSESALDRFSVRVRMQRVDRRTLRAIVQREDDAPGERLTVERLIEMRRACMDVAVAPSVMDYAARIVAGCSPERTGDPVVAECVRYGAGARAVQELVKLGRVRACRQGRLHVSRNDVASLVPTVVGHRLTLTMAARGGQTSVEEVLERVVGRVQG